MGYRMISSAVVFCYILSLLICACFSSEIKDVENVTLFVNGTRRAVTDENFVCATLDWWPATKCDFHQCPWGNAGILSLDLENKILANAIKAFGDLRIRVGGSLQDRVVYQVGDYPNNCTGFERNKSELFGFSEGCLSMDRWAELNKFFNKTGAIITFGLNALVGRNKSNDTLYVGNWSSKNAGEFMAYNAHSGYKIDSYELGNELSGRGIGARVKAKQYGKDMIALKRIIQELYHNLSTQPKALAPAGFYDWKWFDKFLNTTGPYVVDTLTYHFYNLGSGADPLVIKKVLDPKSLDDVAEKMYLNISNNMKRFYPSTTIWVGESGGAYTSGSKNVSPAFANEFWYLNQLGMAAYYDHKVFCRQTLVGGNYGLLDVDTFKPKPDYYGALLFHRLMGKDVLGAHHVGSKNHKNLRVYAHCSKNTTGVSILLINMSNSTTFRVGVQIFSNDPKEMREEYYLTPKDGNILSQEVLLNGKLLDLVNTSCIPTMNPRLVNASSVMEISPHSVVFATFKSFGAAVCT